MSNNVKGIFFALIAFASYSFMDATIKYIVTFNNISWQILIFYVCIIVLVVLFLVILLTKKATFKIKNPFWLIFRAFIGIVNLHIVFFILPKVNLDLFYSLVFISPIIASILAAFLLDEAFNIHKLISIFTGFIGILIITQPWGYFLHNRLSLIELVPLLVALADAAIGIIGRKYLINNNPTTLVFYQFILCTIVSGLVTLYTYKTIPFSETLFTLPVVITAFLSLVGYVFYIKAVQKAPIQIVLPMGYSQMVFGVTISILVFDKYPTYNTILGSIVIILASLYMMLYAAKANK